MSMDASLRSNVTKQKLLRELNGVVRCAESEQGDPAYIEKVVTNVLCILPSGGKKFVDRNKQYAGTNRLCDIILKQFRYLEKRSKPSANGDVRACVLGMHGAPGSGKSTLSKFLCEAMFEDFGGKVVYIDLPTKFDPRHVSEDSGRLKNEYSTLLSTFTPHENIASMDLGQMRSLLQGTRSRHKMFVVLDNISPLNFEIYKEMVQAILLSDILRSRSRVMLVAQSSAILEFLLREVTRSSAITENLLIEVKRRCTITKVPCLTEEEAMDVIRNQYPSVNDEVLTHLLRKSSFRPRSSSPMYIPFVFEQVGVLLRKKGCNNVEDVDVLLRMVGKGKQIVIQDLLKVNFDYLEKDLQVLFFDIALFIIPAGYSNLSDATRILCRMHGINEA